MAVAGHRFHVNLSSDDEDDRPEQQSSNQSRNVLSSDFIGDIRERPTPSRSNPPAPPQGKSSTTGFPAHKKRTRISAFKKQQTENASSGVNSERGPEQAKLPAAGSAPPKDNFDEIERRRINEENDERLAQMSEAEIEQERKELLEGLSPSLIERLLKRANIDDEVPNVKRDTGRADASTRLPSTKISEPQKVQSDISVTEKPKPVSSSTATDPEAAPTSPPPDLQPASHTPSRPPIHFPSPPSAPALDPSSPDFLANLHTKYYPDLPADPSKLAWMAESSSKDPSPYSPTNESLLPSEIRFSFTGTIVAPRTALTIPVTAGLHHHGLAPEAAGYTIPELAMLGRSTYPAQRCVAFQTLGRILYRLGKGEFGSEGEELSMGLWKVVNEEKVIQTLAREASEVEGGRHKSAGIYATEAVWLWQKGGGQKWKAQ